MASLSHLDRMRRRVFLSSAGLVALAGCTTDGDGSAASSPSSAATTPASTPTVTQTATPTPTPTPTATTAPVTGSVTVLATVATGLDVPWGLSLLPDGGVLVSTRDDFRIRRLDVATKKLTSVATVSGVVSNVDQQGEAGLLGLAVAPTFATDRKVYLYYSTARDNRIAWATYDESAAAGKQLGRLHVIRSGIPMGVHHNGGRIAFGPDGMLYAGTGEAEDEALAQDKSSLGGKILRMTPAGRPPPGNPFGSVVWTYGHRNVQGLAFDPAGRLWASEFGDKEADELNLIRKGRNYGWPATQGRTSDPAYTSPAKQWGTEEDSPSGIAYAGGAIWMAALQGERLWRIRLDNAKAVGDPQDFLTQTYGRLRSVLALSDDRLLVTTSNRDGRTTARSGDDRILLLQVS